MRLLNPLKLLIFYLCVAWNLFSQPTDSVKGHLESPVRYVSFVDYIYWRYSSPNLAFARTGVGLTNTSPPTEIMNVSKGTGVVPEYRYHSGLKAALGIKFGPQTAFDLTAVYIWLPSKAAGRVSEGDSPILPLNWLTSATLATNRYLSAKLGVQTTFNVIDLQSGYTFLVNQYLALRPFIALSSIIMSGQINVFYEFITPSNVYEITHTHGTCSAWSIGPKMGLDFIVHATKNFGIFSNINLTQQATSLSLKTRQIESRPAENLTFIVQRGTLGENDSVALFNLEFGPTWDQWFHKDQCRVQLAVTWQTIALVGGTNLSFLNNNNTNAAVTSSYRGFNIRGTVEF